MKPLHPTLLLEMSLGLVNFVIAEPFKEQSEGMTISVYPSGSRLSATATQIES